ncbi:MAG TPA: Hook-associated protein 2 [Bacilli bacterium]|nr:Hook-associated protein 2 [Bacilli bacterium]
MKVRINFIFLSILGVLFAGLITLNDTRVFANKDDIQIKTERYNLEEVLQYFELDDGENTIYYSERLPENQVRVVELTIYIGANSKIIAIDEVNTVTIPSKDVYDHPLASKAFLAPLDNLDYTLNSISSNVPQYKLNGGSNSNDFYNFHAYERHHYNESRTSTSSRTQYAKNVDVRHLWRGTRNYPDSTWTQSGDTPRYVYARKYTSNISTSDTPTLHHRFISNTSDILKSTHFPLYGHGFE